MSVFDFSVGDAKLTAIRKVLKLADAAWLVLTIALLISLAWDSRAHPELYMLTNNQNVSGNQAPVLQSPASNVSWQLGQTTTPVYSLKPDWYYKINNLNTYKHFFNMFFGPWGAWLVLTFFLMGLSSWVKSRRIENMQAKM